MNDKHAKRMLILLILMGFVALGTVSVGVSYSLLEDSTKDDNTQVIKAGNVSLKLTEHFKEFNHKLNVLSDKESNLSNEVYSFDIRNTGTASSLYSLYLVNNNPNDYTGKVLDNKYIKVSITVNGEEKGPFNLKEVNGKLIDNERIESKELITYKMRIWFDETYKNELNNNLDAKAYLKLNCKASQNITNNQINNQITENNQNDLTLDS